MTSSPRRWVGSIGAALTCLLCAGALFAAAGSVTYTYGEAGRLKTTTYGTGESRGYAQDAADNRTSVTQALGADTAAPSRPGALAFSSITGTTATANWGVATDNIAVTQYRYHLNAGAWTTLN